MLSNAGWLYLDRLVRGVLALIVGILIARYLGPQSFGKYSYAISIVLLVVFISNLGMDTIVVREIVDEPENESEILGTAFFMRLGAGIVAYLVAVIAAVVTRTDDPGAALLVAVIGLYPIFQAGDVIDFFFQAHLKRQTRSNASWAPAPSRFRRGCC